MQFQKGTSVYTPENEKIGEIDRIVMDPSTREVTHIVVQKGFLFTEDKVVPMSLIGPATSEKVTLRLDEDAFDSLPDFKEEHYRYIDAGPMGTEGPDDRIYPVVYYPPAGTWWGGPLAMYGMPMYVRRTEKNIPAGTIALDERASVIGSDGEQLGEIDRIITDPQSERATHFLIKEGFLLKDKKLIPTNWISTIQADQIYLSVDSTMVEKLPEYSS